MDEDQFIITTTLSYLIVNILVYFILFLTTIFHNQLHIFHISKKFLSRVSRRKSMNAGNDSSSVSVQRDTFKPLIINPTSIPSSDLISESEIISTRIIRSFGVFFSIFLLLTNWLRLFIYLFPTFYPTLFSSSSNLCLIQSFFLHVFTLFHLNLTISIRLFWHCCFLFDQFWQTITQRRLTLYFFGSFLLECFFTWPIFSHKWATIYFDRLFNLCFVDYTFHYSYTFFVLSFTCMIPLFLQIFSHYSQMKSIQKRLHLLSHKHQFQYTSYLTLFWSLLNILLLICVHTPFDQNPWIRMTVYYVQLLVLLIDPILYIFIFRSLPILTLFKSIQRNSIV